MDIVLQEHISTTFNQQKHFFESYKTRDIQFRKEALSAFKKAILTHKQAIYKALDTDLGKTQSEVDAFEIGVVVSEIDYALAHIEEWEKEEAAPVDDFLKPSECFIKHEPLGVTYVIGPFNYPLNLTLSPVVGAIASGCTAIIKPSENTPETASVIEKIIKEAFKAEYIAVVQGAIEENSYLLSLPFDFIFFTGSPHVGKVVMKAASEHLTPVVLELGGKCPTIICPDADLDQVVKNVCAGKFINCGQTCVAPDYLLVHSSIKKQLLDKLVSTINQQFQELGKIGKLVSAAQIEKIQGYLAKTKGTPLTGGLFDKEKRYMQPVIVDNVAWDDALMQQELFAPVLPVISFDDITTVHELVNKHHPKPLAAYVFTKDYKQGRSILDHIPSGDSQINDVLNHAASHYLPFGGIGNSGMGEYHGRYSYEAFTHRKSLRITK